MVALPAVLGWPLSMDIKTIDYTWIVITGHEYRPGDFTVDAWSGKQKARRFSWVVLVNGPM